MMPYVEINEAASLESGLQKGPVQVAFIKAPNFFKFNSGDRVPSLATLEDTHSVIGSVLETDLDEIWRMLQQDVWSPNGEAEQMLFASEVAHSSMSNGDVVLIDGHAWVCTEDGFVEIVE